MCWISLLPTFHWPELSHKALSKCKGDCWAVSSQLWLPVLEGEWNSGGQSTFLPRRKVPGGSQPHLYIKKCIAWAPAPGILTQWAWASVCKDLFSEAQPGLRVTCMLWSVYLWHYLSTVFQIISQASHCERCSLNGFNFVSAGKIVFAMIKQD